MNKGRRHELKMLKYQKRLKNYNLRLRNPEGKFYAFRSSGKPCSCWTCKPKKYDRNNPKFKPAPIHTDYAHKMLAA